MNMMGQMVGQQLFRDLEIHQITGMDRFHRLVWVRDVNSFIILIFSYLNILKDSWFTF